MTMRFLRGNSQAPKGHAILIARSASDSRVIYSTYCLVPPIPMSLAKYLPPLFAAQIPAEELQDATNLTGMPIPPMLEEAFDLSYLEMLAEHRDDDLCDIGTVTSKDEVSRMQLATTSSHEYGQLYASYFATLGRTPTSAQIREQAPLEEVDAEELLLQTMPDRQKLAELGKLVGTTRYAIGGHDTALLQETKRKMERFVRLLADKYRGQELVAAATTANEQGAKLAELYLKRAYKLLDEEYADIPGIERAIRELQE